MILYLHRSRMGHVHRPTTRSPIENHQAEESPDKKTRSHCHNQLPQLQRRFRRILFLIPVSLHNYYSVSYTFNKEPHRSRESEGNSQKLSDFGIFLKGTQRFGKKRFSLYSLAKKKKITRDFVFPLKTQPCRRKMSSRIFFKARPAGSLQSFKFDRFFDENTINRNEKSSINQGKLTLCLRGAQRLNFDRDLIKNNKISGSI